MVYGSKAFLRHFKAAGHGHVINVSSLFGLIGVPDQSAYNASKFAIRGYTEALALELKETPIRVSSVHPGGILTDIARNSRFNKSIFKKSTKEKSVARFDAVAKTTPAQAAAVILKGVTANRRRILIGLDAKILDILQRLMPTRYGDFLYKVLK
jgi:short-subunit dehydrogenase